MGIACIGLTGLGGIYIPYLIIQFISTSMMKTIYNFNFLRSILSILVNTLFIITKGLILCFKNLCWLFIGAGIVVFCLYHYILFFMGIACIGLTGLVSSFAILLFLFRIYSINKYKYVDSKFAYVFFKAYLGKIHMVGLFKLFTIYFVNIKMLLQFDFNILLLIISSFYFLLFILSSETVIIRLFNIHQGFILICNCLDNINSSFNNINEDINYNVDNSLAQQRSDNGVDNIILHSSPVKSSPVFSYSRCVNVNTTFVRNLKCSLVLSNFYRLGEILFSNNVNLILGRNLSNSSTLLISKSNNNVIQHVNDGNNNYGHFDNSLSLNIDNSNLNTRNLFSRSLRELLGGAGYNTYKEFFSVGLLEELLENENLLQGRRHRLKMFISSLSDQKTYTVLSVIRWSSYESGRTEGITLGTSFKITSKNSGYLLGKKLRNEIIAGLTRYGIDSTDSELVLMYRKWLDLSEFNVSLDNIAKSIDNDLLKEQIKKESQDKIIQNRLEKSVLNSYNSILMDNYGEEIIENGNIIGYKIFEHEGVVVKRVVDENGVESNLVIVKEIINGKLIVDEDNSTASDFIKWIDTRTDDGFVREMNKIKIYFNHDGAVQKIEGEYYFPDYPVTDIDFEYDSKLGAIDFETFGEYGLGNQSVYAGGWCTKDFMKLIYIEDNELPLNVVKRTIESIFEEKELDGYTFFAPATRYLGRFDSLFLIKGVVDMEDITINPIWKDNTIISISIKHKKYNRKIKLLDSMLFTSGSLRDILYSFNCKIKKDFFPYSFVNQNNLFYIGNKPDISYYDLIPFDVYKQIPDQWDMKAETLSYLESDIRGLLEYITKFSESTFNDYSLNITKFSTAPALSMGIFTSGFYDEHRNKIKMIKGKVEEDIRQAYFGGNVEVFANEIKKGFLYDMNSQYSYGMLNDMPVGNPIYTTDNNLDNIFGFVYGKVTAPSSDFLRVPFIQYRDPKTGLVSCPRGEFNRMIFSEEIKYALKHGYKFDLQYGYKFNRGKGLFNKFVEKHYELKKIATDPVKRQMSKSLLVSLYGKFGMREQNSKLKIMSVESAKHIKKNYNYSIFAHLNDDKVLVRYSSRIKESLRQLFKYQEQLNKDGRYKMNEIGLGKKKGVISAVQIAAAIASYSRISTNEYKNIPGNPCIMSDTDSVVLPYKLEDKYVGPELGQMKLEHEIKHGIFIRKKLYAIKTSTDKTIIKASGANSKNLNFNNFVDLLNGKPVETKRLSFNVEWKKLEVNIVESQIILQGLDKEPIRILNKERQEKAISFPKAYPLVKYYNGSETKHNIKENPIELDKGEDIVIHLPAPTEFTTELLVRERNYLIYNAKGFTTKVLNTLQANRILNNIKNCIDKVNSLTQKRIRFKHKLSNLITPNLPYSLTVESKIFYKYGEEGKRVLALLKSYLNSLDFLDLFFLLAGTDPDTFFDRLDIYSQKFNNNQSISHRFSYKNRYAEFKLKIKNVTPTNKLDEKGQIIIQHEVQFDINKVSPPIYYRKDGKDDIEKVLKHTAKTKFVIKRVSLYENLFYKPMLSDYYTCVKPKNKINDYLENPLIWFYMLELANENLLRKLLKQEHVIKADNSAPAAETSDHNRLNNKNKKININNLFKGARSFSTSSLNFYNKSYASQVNMSDKQKFKSLKRTIETYITDNEEIEKINLEYENYYTNLVKFKSKNLKNKIKSYAEKGILSITNKDLEIFRIKSESTDHIVLSHIDMDNWYMIEVSISKFNPDLFGNYICYNLMLYEREPGFNTDFYLSNSIRWADEITVDAIYKEYSPLKLKLQSHFLDYTRDFNNIPLNLLLIHPSLIKTKYIRSLSTIYYDIYKDNSNLETIINNNDCRKRICNVLMQVSKIKHSLSLQGRRHRFIINNELFEIDPVFINNLIQKDNLSDTLRSNFVNLLPIKSYAENCTQEINSDMNLTMHSKDDIIQIKRLFIFNKKKKPKVSLIAIFDFNKENKTLNFKTVLENKKDKYKNIFFKDKLYNIPDLFFSNHFKENFDYQINKNKTDKDKIFKNYLNNNKVNLISTFCFVYNLDQTFKNTAPRLYLLHFNHITGKIDFYLDYYSSSGLKLIKLEKTSAATRKNYNSLKLFNLILDNLKNNHKNIFEFKIKDFCASKYVVQLSSTVLNNIYNNGEVNNTFNSSKLFKLSKSYLNYLTDNSNVTISLIDFNDKFLPFFLKDFLIIYRNKKNSQIKIDDIILNFNKLVESRYRKIKNYK